MRHVVWSCGIFCRLAFALAILKSSQARNFVTKGVRDVDLDAHWATDGDTPSDDHGYDIVRNSLVSELRNRKRAAESPAQTSSTLNLRRGRQLKQQQAGCPGGNSFLNAFCKQTQKRSLGPIRNVRLDDFFSEASLRMRVVWALILWDVLFQCMKEISVQWFRYRLLRSLLEALPSM